MNSDSDKKLYCICVDCVNYIVKCRKLARRGEKKGLQSAEAKE